MISWFKGFYLEFKGILECSAVVLVITGLFLNITVSSFFAQQSLHFVQFILLLLSCFFVSYLLYLASHKIIEKIREIPEPDGDKTAIGLVRQINFIVLQAFVGIGILFLTFLFSANLFVFLVDYFTRESVLFGILVMSYIIGYFISKYFFISLNKTNLILLFGNRFKILAFMGFFIITLFAIIIPAIIFAIIYFNQPEGIIDSVLLLIQYIIPD